MIFDTDADFMSRAIRIAKKGRYTNDPNPNVGCVLVKDNTIIAEGWHQFAGKGHAEVEALKNCADAKAATAYVTLEPCSHYGKTPPCCDALIAAGVKRVVVAMQDPNPHVSGRGLARLREAGVDVECGLLQEDAEALNTGFLKRMRTGMPYVISKMAMSLDGRTAMASGESQWITSGQSRKDVHRMRAESSAVLTGIKTVLADDCSLTARLADCEILQPDRVVLDSSLNMPSNAKMAKLPGRSLVLTCSQDERKKQTLEHAGFEVVRLPSNQQGQVDLDAVVQFLGEQQYNQVLVEGGAVLNGALIKGNWVDEWVVYIASSILGSEARALFDLPETQFMRDKINLKIKSVRHLGNDLRINFGR